MEEVRLVDARGIPAVAHVEVTGQRTPPGSQKTGSLETCRRSDLKMLPRVQTRLRLPRRPKTKQDNTQTPRTHQCNQEQVKQGFVAAW